MLIKWLAIGFLVLLALVIIVTLYVTGTEWQQSQVHRDFVAEQQTSTDEVGKSAVIVFSRSGSTSVLANHIAAKQNARLIEINAKDYDLGVPGWLSALADARNHVADITPENLDLTEFDTIYLGSPIWLYSPAPPIWQVVQNNDFSGKHVVLFNTFNSKFEQTFIDDFKKLVIQKGAISFEHQYVKRGRMGAQLSVFEMLSVFDNKYPG
ncbi:flavodoxin family protein [Planctobacterium marinum]|uniref:flavodoxin family protein n=1 Tax=Planctobacterium marinum TaxID=1631968 RepID=UPI001E2C4675|nr:hypothetical protein [Planctobacterium marinum]MCC2604653.1 hypothetical protein [Planctobacterium marinum]